MTTRSATGHAEASSHEVLYVGATPVGERLESALRAADADLRVTVVAGVDEVLARIETETPLVVVTDHSPPDLDGVAVVRACHRAVPDLPVVVFTADGSERVAGEAVVAGAVDYLPRDDLSDATAAARIRDAADRRETERSFLRRVLDDAPVGITLSDPDSPEHALAYVNDRFVELTGYEREAVLGENCNVLQGPGTAEESVEAMRHALAEERPVQVDVRNYRADGTAFWNRVTLAPVTGDHGTGTTFVGFQEDVTQTKEYEQELRRQNDRLDRFASTASHDLRGPLSVAGGRLELAAAATDDPTVLDHLDRIAAAHERMSTMIDDILVRARDGELVGDVEWIDLDRLAADCWRSVAAPSATLSVDTGRAVRGNRIALYRLMVNLLRNAVEHGGSDVTVRVDTLEDGFVVEDDGPGIVAADHEAVFEPGYSTAGTGGGLGLAIVAEVCDDHGWDCRVTASETGGTRIEVSGVDAR